MWTLEPGTHLVLCKGVGAKSGATQNHEDNRGRLFTQNADGTISPSRAPHLVLGATAAFNPAAPPPAATSRMSGAGLFLLHDADFAGREDRATREPCASLEQVGLCYRFYHLDRSISYHPPADSTTLRAGQRRHKTLQ